MIGKTKLFTTMRILNLNLERGRPPFYVATPDPAVNSHDVAVHTVAGKVPS